MALAVKPALDGLRADLIAAGFPGSHYDPALVSPPAAVWIEPRTVHDITLGAGATLEVYLYVLIVANDDEGSGTADLLAKIDDSLDTLLGPELGLALSEDPEPIDLTASVLLPGHATPLPAVRLAVDIDI